MLKIGHTVKVPKTLRGPSPSDEEEIVQVPEELERVAGIPLQQDTVTFYSRHYPVESHNVENFVYRKWSRQVSDIKETRDEHERLNRPIVKAAAESGNIEPTVEPTPGKDVTAEIKAKALELGFAMVGITAYDPRYTYKSKRNWVKPFPHAICLAMEQPYEETQTIPSEPAESAVFATYRREGRVGLELADYIRSIGYHAQVHSPNDASSVVHPMFVQAGMGQMGAMGYLLSPPLRLSTQADDDYHRRLGVLRRASGLRYPRLLHHLSSVREPMSGRALMREQVWWRGVEKFKIIAKRCRPVMARYAACGICMRVCPIQRYGLPAVMDHYATTGQVLGKGTHNLEGYDMHDIGYFGPGELPRFDSDFFHIPEGYADQHALKS